jgi:hypothetical protein
MGPLGYIAKKNRAKTQKIGNWLGFHINHFNKKSFNIESAEHPKPRAVSFLVYPIRKGKNTRNVSWDFPFRLHYVVGICK